MFRQVLKMMVFFSVIALAGCGGYTDQNDPDDPVITSQDRVSACGGFESEGSPLLGNPVDYCAAEVLHWAYDEAADQLKLADARVLLNCCGEHAMTVAEADGVYVFTETDDPEFGDARCGCMCVFDFAIEVTGITTGVIPIRINREVSDWPEGSGLVLEAELDLTQGSGTIVIDDTDIYPWCGEE